MIDYIISFLVAVVVGLVAGKILIPVLRRLKAGQSIREVGPTWHMTKQGTPTMGGIIFIAAILAALLIYFLLLGGIKEGFGALFILIFALIFGVIGFLDDYVKVKKKQNLGLTAIQKFLLQLAAAIAFIALLRYVGFVTPRLYIPFFNVYWELPWIVYMIFAAFVIVGTVNSVNLTDGIDGLAAGVTLPVALFFAVAAFVLEQVSTGIFATALAGGLIAFLVFNYHPAKVFMGDTGSLFLGGAVCGLAFALDIPLILIPVGIIYIAETLSDIIQVGYFKLTHGKRIFRMAPLHHHLEMGGWSEKKLFWVFLSITVVMCVLSFWGIYLK